MSGRPSRSQVRRSLLVGLNGLAVWVLAVVLESYLSGAVVRFEADFADLLVGRTVVWLTTPGVGAFELAAYGGLALVFVGPAWYLVGAGRFGLVPRWSGSSDEPIEFEYDHDTSSGATSGPQQATVSASGRSGNADRMPSASGTAGWIDTVFDDGPQSRQPSDSLAAGDFYRSSTRPASVQRPSPGMGLADGGKPVSEPNTNDDRHTPRAADDDADRSRPSEPSSEPDGETEDGSASDHEPDRPGIESADPPEPDSGSADPMVALSETITAQQAAVADVSDRIASATTDDAIEAIGRQLASAPADAGDAIAEAMRTGLDGTTTDLQPTLKAIRADQDRLESAFAAATADD